jgi:large subunit ribosomal protein L15
MHNLQPAKGSKTTVKRVGRGNASGKGTTAGRGSKGQKARSGGRAGLKLLGLRGLMLSTPKLRGFKSLNRPSGEVSLSDLDKAYGDGDTVSLVSLKKRGLVSVDARKVKVLANGTLDKRLNVKEVAVSDKAKEKIVAAGGSVS